MPAIGANDQIRLQFFILQAHADDALLALDEARDFGVHAQAKARVALRLAGEEIEEVPLRHHGDEARAHWQARKVRDGDVALGDAGRKARDLLVRQTQQSVEQPELVHHLERRRMDRVAAEVAQEVGVLLEHEDLDACVGEEQPEHHPGRPSAGDATGRREGGHGSGRRECPRPWPRRRHVENRHVEKSGSRWPGGRLATASSSVRAWRHSLAGRTSPFVPT